MSELTSLVSIIIPCYNAEPWIAECLDSAIAQTYRPLEIIVIDDGSTDGSLKVIQSYVAQYPELIRYETGPNHGGCAARNRGFALSMGTYALFLDVDDYLEPETIAGQVDVLNGRANAVATCPWWYIEWNGQTWVQQRHHQANVTDPIVAELRYGNFIPAPALLWPRNAIAQLGEWDETLWANQDGDLRIRARLSGYQFVQSTSGGFIYRRHGKNTVSGQISDRALESRIRVIEKVEAALTDSGRLEMYRFDLARMYHSLASGIMSLNEEMGERANQSALRLGGLRSVHGSFQHRLLCYTVGLKRKERLARWLARSPLAGLMGRSQLTRSTEYQMWQNAKAADK
jgi:glycosyltransferase involved in cell wall biosynthesis